MLPLHRRSASAALGLWHALPSAFVAVVFKMMWMCCASKLRMLYTAALSHAAHALHCYTASCLYWVAACRFILLEADATLTPWSKICVAQADCILLVGTEESGPQVRAVIWVHSI